GGRCLKGGWGRCALTPALSRKAGEENSPGVHVSMAGGRYRSSVSVSPSVRGAAMKALLSG
ncbi:hypothetical protein, partial [Xanthomonas sp. WHRI 8812E]|uniref:hypothetical protein n=1 Tax=Xanthomonas sp. WHRI 8812E TaxID=3059651 RepID=UPI002B230A90